VIVAVTVTATFKLVLPLGVTRFGEVMLGATPVVPPLTVEVTGLVNAPTALTLTV
jgi:hypothetical protein